MEMGEPLLLVINDMMYDGKRKAFFRENASGYKTGINDGIAEILLNRAMMITPIYRNTEEPPPETTEGLQQQYLDTVPLLSINPHCSFRFIMS